MAFLFEKRNTFGALVLRVASFGFRVKKELKF